MPKYVANAHLLHQGKLVTRGEEIELEEEQANRLGDKVQRPKFETKREEEVTVVTGNIEDYTVNELRAVAKDRGIEGYTNLNKKELYNELKE